MVPYKAGKANEGHSCVKGRFAYGYATHQDRILKPMIRKRIDDPWREVSWDEALQLRGERIQAHPGATTAATSIGAITSSRCTNEEVFLVQKLVRAGFGNNNVDTCARVCHSPTGYGLSQDLRHLGRHAGFQVGRQVRRHHGHRRQSDRRASGVRLAHEEAPARGRAPHRHRSRAASTSCEAPHVEADHHLRAEARHQRRGAQRARACRRDRGPRRRGLRARALRLGQFRILGALHRRGAPFARGGRRGDRRRPRRVARGRAALCDRRQWRDLLRPRRHRAQPGLDRW